MIIENPTFCLTFTGVHFPGELQHVGHVGEQKIKCRPIKTQERTGARLQDELYGRQAMAETSWDKFYVLIS